MPDTKDIPEVKAEVKASLEQELTTYLQELTVLEDKVYDLADQQRMSLKK
jgi:hypothetical protein